MDLGDDEDTDLETSAQELEQILPKAVFHRLSPVAGGHWRVYRQGPNEYQAVYSMRSGEHVFAISSHSMSTVVSVDEIYNSFPVHRARSLNNNQTQRILPQVEGLLQSRNSPGSLANSPGMMATHFNGVIAQESVQTNGPPVSHSTFATANFPSPAPGDIQLGPQYQMGQNMIQDSPSGSFMSMTHADISPHDNIISPFLSEGSAATQWPTHSAIGNDEASVGNAASDGAAMPRIDTTGDFTLAYSRHDTNGAHLPEFNISVPTSVDHSDLFQASWGSHAAQNATSSQHAQMLAHNNESQIIINETMQLHNFGVPHSDMSNSAFPPGMVMFDENNIGGSSNMHFDASKNTAGHP
ncbi:hypothetical protein F5X68DRAFT_274922 [Plectosphaerella plurivora]|uniref:Uncharacterized protein n=1 Tax=Plectosphaerella plurivora TaxID=936078 RepID=A0A9P8VDY1_9PEZI|nr:hypothetical protein F5X68DRAFT_274922 [Plectosphaerella plurivora]